MANIIDLSVYRKEPITIKSLTGDEYNIEGNFSTEFYLYLYDTYSKIQKLQKDDYKKALEVMKELVLEIIKLDRSKSPTKETIKEQFNDFNALMAMISGVMKYANEITSDPNSESPTLS